MTDTNLVYKEALEIEKQQKLLKTFSTFKDYLYAVRLYNNTYFFIFSKYIGVKYPDISGYSFKDLVERLSRNPSEVEYLK